MKLRTENGKKNPKSHLLCIRIPINSNGIHIAESFLYRKINKDDQKIEN